MLLSIIRNLQGIRQATGAGEGTLQHHETSHRSWFAYDFDDKTVVPQWMVDEIRDGYSFESSGCSLKPEEALGATAGGVCRAPGQFVTSAFGVKHTRKEYYTLQMIFL